MQVDQSVSVNLSACVKTATNIGSDHYVNICTGEAFDVAWGSVDWFLAGGLGLMGVFTLFLFAMIAVALWDTR